MALSEEDKQEIADLIKASLPAPAPTTPVETAAQTAEIIGQASPTTPGLEAFQQMIEQTLAKQTQTQESQLATQLFQERVDNLSQSNPQLSEYLNSNDEFGQPRMERINSIDDYGKRMQALQTVAQSFSQAQVASTQGSQQPVIPKKIQEAADKTTKEYNELDQKLQSGDMTPEEHAARFFDKLNNDVIDQMAQAM